MPENNVRRPAFVKAEFPLTIKDNFIDVSDFENVLRVYDTLPIERGKFGQKRLFKVEGAVLPVTPSFPLDGVIKPIWHHFYVTGVIDNKKEYFFKISLRGKVTEEGDFYWFFNKKDTSRNRVIELESKLAQLYKDLKKLSYLSITLQIHIDDQSLNKTAGCDRGHPVVSLRLSGRLLIYNTYFFTNFLNGADFELIPELLEFYHLPGADFAGDKFLDASDVEREMIKDGNEYGLFRRRLHKEVVKEADDKYPTTVRPQMFWLNEKAYRFNNLASGVPGQPALYFRLSRNGIVENREERDTFTNNSISDTLREILRYRTPDVQLDETEVRLIETTKNFVSRIVKVVSDVRLDQFEPTLDTVAKVWRTQRRNILIEKLLVPSPGSSDLRTHIIDVISEHLDKEFTQIRNLTTELTDLDLLSGLGVHLSAAAAGKSTAKKGRRYSSEKVCVLVNKVKERAKSDLENNFVYYGTKPLNYEQAEVVARCGCVVDAFAELEAFWKVFNRATLVKRMARLAGLETTSADVKNALIFRERQRYICIVLDKVNCTECQSLVPPEDLRSMSDVIGALIEGSMAYPMTDATGFALPEVNPELLDDDSLATWVSELCLFGSERCLIYCDPKTSLHSGARAENDADYWRCILRGIEHTVSVKTLLHLMEKGAAKCVREIPKIVDRLKQESVGKDKKKTLNNRDETVRLMSKLAHDASMVLKYLPSVREMAVASSAFRASHAVKKFDYLNEEQFQFGRILKHIDDSIGELISFMQFFEQQRLSLAADRRNDRTNNFTRYLTILGLFLGLLAAVYAAPSYVDTFKDACEDVNAADNIRRCLAHASFRPYGTFFLAGLAVFVLLACILYESLSVSDTKRMRPSWIWGVFLLSVIIVGIWCLLPYMP